MKLIGVDFGDARIGIAVANTERRVATANCTLNVNGIADAVNKVAEKVFELNGEKIVIGLPLNMDGTPGQRATRTKRFTSMLNEKTSLECVLTDERLTTVEALGYLNITGYNKHHKKQVIDALSAQIILQSYLDKTVGES